MPLYTINYYFDGKGSVDIEADTPEQAEEKYYQGDYQKEEEFGENYEISHIDTN